MTSKEVAARRLCVQGLTTKPFPTPEAVVGWLVAMQSQEHAVARWSIGQRMSDSNVVNVDRALERGSIVRTHVLRPTWHFVLPSDIRWLLDLTAPRVHAASALYYRRSELDPPTLVRTTDLVVKSVAGGNHLTREEIGGRLAAAGIPTDGLRLGYILMYAELTKMICSGAPRGRQRTYALFDERVPPADSKSEDEALAELALRYFTSHGPATVDDLRWWSGLRAREVQRGLSAAREQLESCDVDGRTFWFAPGLTCPKPRTTAAHLLQGYDEAIIAFRETRAILDAAGLAGKEGAKIAPLLHVVIVDGQLAGRWRRIEKGRSATIEVQLARELSTEERGALEIEVALYGAFLEQQTGLILRPPEGVAS
jgi:hypothetical protein